MDPNAASFIPRAPMRPVPSWHTSAAGAGQPPPVTVNAAVTVAIAPLASARLPDNGPPAPAADASFAPVAAQSKFPFSSTHPTEQAAQLVRAYEEGRVNGRSVITLGTACLSRCDDDCDAALECHRLLGTARSPWRAEPLQLDDFFYYLLFKTLYRGKRPVEATALLRSLIDSGRQVGKEWWRSAMNACKATRRHDLAIQALDHYRSALARRLAASVAAKTAWLLHGAPEPDHEVLAGLAAVGQAHEWGNYPSAFVHNLVMSATLQAGQPKLVIDLFMRLLAEGPALAVHPSEASYQIVFEACDQIGNAQVAVRAFIDLVNEGASRALPCTARHVDMVCSACIKGGRLDSALWVFDHLLNRAPGLGNRAMTPTYNRLIAACRHAGREDVARALGEHLLRHGPVLDGEILEAIGFLCQPAIVAPPDNDGMPRFYPRLPGMSYWRTVS